MNIHDHGAGQLPPQNEGAREVTKQRNKKSIMIEIGRRGKDGETGRGEGEGEGVGVTWRARRGAMLETVTLGTFRLGVSIMAHGTRTVQTDAS